MTITAEQAAKLLEGTTPGPWRPSKSYRAIVSDSPSGYDDAESVHAYGGHMVCESVQEHNRHLIAAAPDLARALIASEAARKLADERLARATKLLDEARGDLSTYVGMEYPAEARAKYPSVERRWQRDMQLCREIDAFLKETDNG